jgi:competence protein ComGC
MLDMPATAPEQGSFTKDRSIQSHTSNQTRIVYRGRSYTDYQLGTLDKLPKRTLQAALQLDYHANPKTVALAKQWRNQSKLQIVNNALAFYRHHGFSYTLNPPVASQHAIDHFLFESKRGFCEHFATSFVYMMRAAGVPARVVTGYQGGERNGKYLIVRQSDAHAWAEVWLERQGWIRIDPTASIAPERIRFGIAEAIEKISENQTTSIKHSNNHQLPLTLRVKQYPLLHQASLMWDRAEHQWNQSIISYNYRQQQSWLSSWSHQAINQKMMLIVLILTVLLMLAIAIFIIVKNNKTQPNQAQKLYLEFLNKLAPYQLKQDAHESVLDFAIRASQQLPQAQAQILAIARMYNLLEYSRLDSIEKKALNQSFKKIVQTFSLKSSRSK